jgi:hypothetical protein
MAIFPIHDAECNIYAFGIYAVGSEEGAQQNGEVFTVPGAIA